MNSAKRYMVPVLGIGGIAAFLASMFLDSHFLAPLFREVHDRLYIYGSCDDTLLSGYQHQLAFVALTASISLLLLLGFTFFAWTDMEGNSKSTMARWIYPSTCGLVGLGLLRIAVTPMIIYHTSLTKGPAIYTNRWDYFASLQLLCLMLCFLVSLGDAVSNVQIRDKAVGAGSFLACQCALLALSGDGSQSRRLICSLFIVGGLSLLVLDHSTHYSVARSIRARLLGKSDGVT
jgi:hypothetical protein